MPTINTPLALTFSCLVSMPCLGQSGNDAGTAKEATGDTTATRPIRFSDSGQALGDRMSFSIAII